MLIVGITTIYSLDVLTLRFLSVWLPLNIFLFLKLIEGKTAHAHSISIGRYGRWSPSKCRSSCQTGACNFVTIIISSKSWWQIHYLFFLLTISSLFFLPFWIFSWRLKNYISLLQTYSFEIMFYLFPFDLSISFANFTILWKLFVLTEITTGTQNDHFLFIHSTIKYHATIRNFYVR